MNTVVLIVCYNKYGGIKAAIVYYYVCPDTAVKILFVS